MVNLLKFRAPRAFFKPSSLKLVVVLCVDVVVYFTPLISWVVLFSSWSSSTCASFASAFLTNSFA